MGVPAFYRWLSEKYPKIVQDLLEQRDNVIDGTVVPLDLSQPNPNGIEFDNLYVDMNGLIHPCSHPEDRDAPCSEREMYENVTKYVDRLVAGVRPRRVLFLAIDGVAPRAKMNQQRSRRFRAAQDAKERKEMAQEVIDEMVSMGYDAPEPKRGADWDSNVITPGTSFMAKLSVFLRFYILDRMNNSPYWRGIKVVLSDASEPGEGEHKIMNFIRNQRAQEGYDPNQRHILHGLDADLIMLALATHEAHFTILREKVFFGRKGKEEPEKSQAQMLLESQWIQSGARLSELRPNDEWIFAKPLQALSISVLREYLVNEFRCLAVVESPTFDLERVIDDFIFLCFFVGNDFLPHLPSLDIRDGALDFLIDVYKELLPSLGEYLTSPGGNLNLEQVDVILGRVGEIEDIVFQKKKEAEEALERKKEHQNQNRNNFKSESVQAARKRIESLMAAEGVNAVPISAVPPVGSLHTGRHNLSQDANRSAASALKEKLGLTKRSSSQVNCDAESDSKRCRSIEGISLSSSSPTHSVQVVSITSEKLSVVVEAVDATPNEVVAVDEVGEEDEIVQTKVALVESALVPASKRKQLSPEAITKTKEELKRRIAEKEQSMIDKYKKEVQDGVKLHEVGWKERYYGEKHKKENIKEGGGLAVMLHKYVQGLCWVLKYYYEGVPSWNWYYPFHYAPFASDLVNIDRYGPIVFELSEPFHPIEQLLAVLPSNSVHALPEPCRWLMTDPESPIIDLYNADVPIDPNGKPLPWLWILLLPFIDEKRVTAAFSLCKPTLSLEDRRRNAFGGSVIFLHKDTHLAREILTVSQYRPGKESDPEVVDCLKLFHDDSDGFEGASDGNERAAAQLPFDAIAGRGMSGTVCAPPPLFFAALHSTISPPPADDGDDSQSFNPFTAMGSMIYSNCVVVFSYELPPAPAVHQSQLLPGVVLSPPALESFDLIVLRRPRLNRAGFNICDILNSMRNKSRGGGGFQNDNSHSNYNRHGGYDYNHTPQHNFVESQGPQGYGRRGDSRGSYPGQGGWPPQQQQQQQYRQQQQPLPFQPHQQPHRNSYNNSTSVQFQHISLNTTQQQQQRDYRNEQSYGSSNSYSSTSQQHFQPPSNRGYGDQHAPQRSGYNSGTTNTNRDVYSNQQQSYSHSTNYNQNPSSFGHQLAARASSTSTSLRAGGGDYYSKGDGGYGRGGGGGGRGGYEANQSFSRVGGVQKDRAGGGSYLSVHSALQQHGGGSMPVSSGDRQPRFSHPPPQDNVSLPRSGPSRFQPQLPVQQSYAYSQQPQNSFPYTQPQQPQQQQLNVSSRPLNPYATSFTTQHLPPRPPSQLLQHRGGGNGDPLSLQSSGSMQSIRDQLLQTVAAAKKM